MAAALHNATKFRENSILFSLLLASSLGETKAIFCLRGRHQFKAPEFEPTLKTFPPAMPLTHIVSKLNKMKLMAFEAAGLTFAEGVFPVAT